MGKLLIGFHHGIGDFINFTPALRALSKNYSEIHLCCKPDLITIDMGLPVRPHGKLHSGQDLYLALQSNFETAGIPVIMVTGHEPVHTQTLREFPPLLLKPFRARELLEKVAAQLAGGS